MNDQFDELTKGLARSVTRRGALKKFALGLAGLALSALGLSSKAQARRLYHCNCNKGDYGCPGQKNETLCWQNCPAICHF